MIRRATLITAALAVFAFAAPPAASAAAQLTNGSGSVLPVGTKITGRSTNTFVFTSIGTLECEEMVVPWEVTHNSGGTVEGVGTGAGETFNCFSEGEAIQITDLTLFSLRMIGPSSGSKGVTFEAHLPVIGTCHYFALAIPMTYTHGGSVLHFQGPLLTIPSACGTAEIEGDTTLSGTSGFIVITD
jgi:hypothetical protein